MPDRDYYFKTDEKSVEIRKLYVAHMQKMLQLAGASPEAAAKQAQAVMALETELAKARSTASRAAIPRRCITR